MHVWSLIPDRSVHLSLNEVLSCRLVHGSVWSEVLIQHCSNQWSLQETRSCYRLYWIKLNVLIVDCFFDLWKFEKHSLIFVSVEIFWSVLHWKSDITSEDSLTLGSIKQHSQSHQLFFDPPAESATLAKRIQLSQLSDRTATHTLIHVIAKCSRFQMVDCFMMTNRDWLQNWLYFLSIFTAAGVS